MKRSLVLGCLAFYFCSSAFAEESIEQLSLQGEALWDAKDFGQAEELYQRLMKANLPSWQKARLSYNMGSIYLAQHRTIEAIHQLQHVHPLQLSLPRFGRDLLLNQGAAYLQYAESLAPDAPLYRQKRLYTEQGWRLLEQAEQIECAMQQTEDGTMQLPCTPHLLTKDWTARVLREMDQIHREIARDWMDDASIESISTFLFILIQQWLSDADLVMKENQGEEFQKQAAPYLEAQAKSLITLWESLKIKSLTSAQQTAFDKALGHYQEGVDSLKNESLSEAITKLKQSSTELGSLSFKDQIDLRLALLTYEILLVQPFLSVSDIESVQWSVGELKKETKELSAVNQLIQSGLQALKDKNLIQARFNLLAGFCLLQANLPLSAEPPIPSLKRALADASRSLELLLLAQLLHQKPDDEENRLNIRERQQKLLLVHAEAFIPAVLQEQSIRYHDAQNKQSNCQQSPWDQVIPLFDQGYRSAEAAAQLLQSPKANAEEVAGLLEQMISNWLQALALLKNPPQETHAGSASSNRTPKNLAETYRLIQEMYMEDQPQPAEQQGELHSW